MTDCTCPIECDCECPEPVSGPALISNSCPVHNIRPSVYWECVYGGEEHRNGAIA